MAAAVKSTPADRQLHSFHSYFLRPASPDEPIAYSVDHVRDGRSFSSRQVAASQNAKHLFQAMASLHTVESGIVHSEEMPPAPKPEELQPFETRYGSRIDQMTRWFTRLAMLDLRYIDQAPFDPAVSGRPARQMLWIKTRDHLDIDPRLHVAILGYASDFSILDPILLHHGMRWTDRAMLGASLDHSMWFHNPFRADEWVLIDAESSVASGARAFATAKFWSIDGTLIASATQEALMRPPATS